MKRILFFFVLLMVPFYVNAYAESYVVMDADSGRVLESKNANTQMLIASTTKIMTAVIALENESLDTKIKVGEEVLEVYGSMIYVDVGEELTLEDLIYGLLMQSGNDAAMVIATHFGYENFISMMNSKAVEIGMKNTEFQNPHGLDDNNTKNYSTSLDLAKLMRYAMKNEQFKKITGEKKYRTKTNVEEHIWYNKNKLLSIYKYSTGGKIGYTTTSKHVFVSSASKGEENLVIATIKDTDRFNTHKNLYEKTFQQYDKYQVLNSYTFSVVEEEYKKYHLYIKNDYFVMLNENDKENLELNIVLKKKKGKVKESEAVGYVDVLLKGKSIHKENIYALSKENKISKIKNWLFFWK